MVLFKMLLLWLKRNHKLEKKSTHLINGKYNTKFNYSADRDYIYRLIKNKNLTGISTRKSEVFGKFSMHGLSSSVGFLEKNLEEINILII